MIRVFHNSIEVGRFDGSTMLWDVATVIKRTLGIPVGEQTYYDMATHNAISKSTVLRGALEVTMKRSTVTCGGCCREQTTTKYKICSGCRDVLYCGESCQAEPWKIHKLTCKDGGTRKRKSYTNAPLCQVHKSRKFFPEGPRDNNEYDLVCTACSCIR